ncbi:adenylate kinase [Candidatus Woesearchaeota archaeon]|nr:MAG: adenylate kinase [Candidatus Woesearchaeota archaeon]
MNIVLLGPPGTGKGTQAERLQKVLNVPHISTGDIFRKLAEEKDELGVMAKEKYWGQGKLVPDEITNKLVEKRLAKDDVRKGFILDGYPRTIEQAKALDKIMKKSGKKIDYVIEIQSSDEVIIKRLAARRICKTCGKVYGLDVPPKHDNKCDIDGSELYQREDDKEEVVRERLMVYRQQTLPLIDYYNKKGILRPVNGEEPIDVILENIVKLVNGKV